MKLNPPKLNGKIESIVKLGRGGKLYPPWAALGHVLFFIPSDYFFSYGEKVFAPVSGKVLAMENGFEDKGYRNLFVDMFRWIFVLKKSRGILAGDNFVEIQLENLSCLKLSGFRRESIRVSVGDNLQVGDFLGELGSPRDRPQPSLWISKYYRVSQDFLEMERIEFDGLLEKDGKVSKNTTLRQGKSVYF